MKATLTCLLLSLITLTSLPAADGKDAVQLKYKGGIFSFSAEQTPPPAAEQNPPPAEKNLLARLNPPAVVPATHASKDKPVADVDERSIAILMADGSEEVVRSILRIRASEIRVMTNNGITGIPFKSLHAATQAYLTPQIEDEAKTRAEAEAAAESYRANRAIQERIDTDLNRTIAARQAADEAQALARAQAIREANAQRASLASAAFDAETERRAIANARRIEQARISYQQQLQYQELQIFNALVEVQQIELLRRLGYLK